jgi:hypothetical protein
LCDNEVLDVVGGATPDYFVYNVNEAATIPDFQTLVNGLFTSLPNSVEPSCNTITKNVYTDPDLTTLFPTEGLTLFPSGFSELSTPYSVPTSTSFQESVYVRANLWKMND